MLFPSSARSFIESGRTCDLSTRVIFKSCAVRNMFMHFIAQWLLTLWGYHLLMRIARLGQGRESAKSAVEQAQAVVKVVGCKVSK